MLASAGELTKETIAKALALAMEDPAFKKAFDSANPGLMDKLKAMVASTKAAQGGKSGLDADSMADEAMKALLPSAGDLAKNIDTVKDCLGANDDLNKAVAKAGLELGSVDPKALLDAVSKMMGEVDADSKTAADKSTEDILNKEGETAMNKALDMLKQDPMSKVVEDALKALQAGNSAMDLATATLKGALTDPKLTDALVNSLLAGEVEMSADDMRKALKAGLMGNDGAKSAVCSGMSGAGAVTEAAAENINKGIATDNAGKADVEGALKKDGSQLDKLNAALGVKPKPAMGDDAVKEGGLAIDAATDEQIMNAYNACKNNPDFMDAVKNNDPSLNKKLSDKAKDDLDNMGEDKNKTKNLADAFNLMSKDELIQLIKKTLNLDKPDC